MRGLFLILVLTVAYSCADQCNTTPEATTCRDLLKPTQSKQAKKAVMVKCIAAQPGLQATIDELKAAAAANASLPSAGATAANASLLSAGAKLANASLPSAGATAANASLLSAGAKLANASLPSTVAKAANASLPSTGATAVNASLPSAGVKVTNAFLPSAGATAVNASLPSAGVKVANASLSSTGSVVAKPSSNCKWDRKENPAGLLKAASKTAEFATLNKCLAKEEGYLLVGARGTSIFDVAKFKVEIEAKVTGTSSQAKTQLGLDKCPEAYLDAFNVYKYMQCVKAYCATGDGPNKKA